MNASTKFQIVDYQPGHKMRWKEINEAWVTEEFYMEAIDHLHCDHPQTAIIDKGGHILIALVGDQVAGTAGILKEDEERYELIKMAVDKQYRGMGIGKALCTAAIVKARSMGAKVFYLYSNTKAATAISIYRKMGFVEVPVDHQEWERANIKMEMTL